MGAVSKMTASFLLEVFDIYMIMAGKFKQINLDYLEKMSHGRMDILVKMLNTYLVSIPAYIEKINLMLESKSWYILGNTAFHAKEIMPIIGLRQVALDLHELDLLCRKGEDDIMIKVYVDRITKIGNEAVEELKVALSFYENLVI